MPEDNRATASSDDRTLAVTGTAQARYNQLTPDRTHFVDRGDKCAKLTIPTIFMKDQQHTSSQKIVDPVQSMGARGVNTLAAKMVLSLLPTNTPFFKLNIDLIEAQGEQDPNADPEETALLKTEVEKGLGVIERAAIRAVENAGDVTVVFEALKHLSITGNVLLHIGEKSSKLYNLNKYVVSRDPEGNMLEGILCEDTAPSSLTGAAKSIVDAAPIAAGASPDRHVQVYTHITYEGDRVKWYQEIMGKKVAGSEGNVPEDGNPWLFLRFMRVDGENYGRGYVEMYLGDLESLEVLSKAIRDAALNAAKVVWLVNANGTTNPKTIATANNGDVKAGNAADVTALRLDKAADMQIAKAVVDGIRSQLAHAFMINAEVMRNAERVTAEEVRFIAQELDDSLGGIYSVLSQDFQLPFVRRRLFLLRKGGKMPQLPEGVEPVIVTGFAALGRGHDRDKLMRYAETIAQLVGKEKLESYINLDELASRLAVSDGIETKGLLISSADRAAKQEQDQQAASMQNLAPEMMKQVGPMIAQQLQQGQAPDGQPPSPQGPAVAA